MVTPRLNHGRVTRRTKEQMERDARCVELRNRHLSFATIAAQVGFASAGSAFKAYERGLADLNQEMPDEGRAIELERYDELSRIAWRIAYGTYYKVSASGKVALHPVTAAPLVEPGPNLDAVKTLVLLSKQRRALMGYDAPARTEVRHVDNNFDADIAALMGRMAAGGEGPASGHPEILDVAPGSETGSAPTGG